MTLQIVLLVTAAFLVGGGMGYFLRGFERINIECVGHAGQLGGEEPPPRKAFEEVNDYGTDIMERVVGEKRRDDYILLIWPQPGADFHYYVVRSERTPDLSHVEYQRVHELIEARFRQYLQENPRDDNPE